RRDPRRHRSRPPGRGHRRRRRDHRMDLRSARHGSVPRRRDRPARLPGDPGHQPACRLDHRVDESQRGPPLRGARPADPLPVMADAADTIAVPEARARPWRLPRAVGLTLRFCGRKPLGAIGAVIILLLLVMAVFADRIAPHAYDESITGARMQPPSSRFWMGTDNLARDIWSRVVYGARISITVGFATVALATLIATAIGISSAYLGGGYDIVVQRVVDAWMSFPGLVIVLSLMAALGPGLLNLIFALSILGAAGASRVIRGATLSTMHDPYVEAARAIGAGHLRIILRYLLPNVMATIIILATIGLGTVILAESGLSFLGFGIPPPYPSWGGMLSGSGRSFMYYAPWMALFPGTAISLDEAEEREAENRRGHDERGEADGRGGAAGRVTHDTRRELRRRHHDVEHRVVDAEGGRQPLGRDRPGHERHHRARRHSGREAEQ